jgi:hypothetical protein
MQALASTIFNMKFSIDKYTIAGIFSFWAT